MKKFIFFSLLAGLFAGDCLTTEVLAYQDDSVSSLRYRGKNVTPEEQRPFLTRNVTTLRDVSIEQKEEEIDEDEVLSSLGQIWEDFKSERSTGQAPWYPGRPIGRVQAALVPSLLVLDALCNA